MIDRDTVLGLIPHQGTMCLLDAVAAWDEASIHALAHSHRDPNNPLRRDGRLAALHLCEYGAQAMAVHGGLLAQAQGGRAAAGVLVALREVELRVERIDDLPGAIEGEAELVAASEASQQYVFRLFHEGRLLAQGRAAAMLGPA